MPSATTDSSRPLIRVGLRYLRRHPWQTALMILGVMLGVAVMVAIDLANAAASRAFDLSTDAIAGKATHQIVGGPTGLDEAIYTRLRVEGGVRLAAPVVTDYVSSPQLGDRPIQLLGVDPFAEAPFRSYLLTGNAARATGFGRETSPDGATSAAPLTTFLTRPGALLISEGLARENGLAVGDPVALIVAGRQITGSVAGLLQPADSLSRRALDGLILADIATAQEIAGRPRQARRHRSDPAGDDPAAAQELARLLPPDAQIVPVAARTGALSQMTAAFRINLTALSLLALVVGMFLHLQQHDLLGRAAAAALRHAALPGCHAGRDRPAGAGRSGGGRRPRLRVGSRPRSHPGPGRRPPGDADDQRPLFRRDGARDRDPGREPDQRRGPGRPGDRDLGGAAGLGSCRRAATADARALRHRASGAAGGSAHGAGRSVRPDCRRRAAGDHAGRALDRAAPAPRPSLDSRRAECPDRQLRRHLPRHRRFRAAGSRRHPAADARRRAGHEQALRRDRPPCAAQHHRRVEPHRRRHRRARWSPSRSSSASG